MRALRLCGEVGLSLSNRLRLKIQMRTLRSVIKADNVEYAVDGTSCQRISFVIHDLSAAGAERQIWLNAVAAKRLGMEVSVLVLQPLCDERVHYLGMLREAGVSVLSCAYPSDCTEAAAIAMALDENKAKLLERMPGERCEILWNLLTHLCLLRPQRLHCFVDLSCVLGGLAAVILRIPYVVFSFRNKNPANFHHSFAWVKPYYAELIASRRVILSGNSEAGNLDYAKWLGVAPAAIAVIRNAVEDTRWKQITPSERLAARTRFGIGSHHACVVGVFQMVGYKRPLVFLNVIRRVRDRIGQPFVVLVAGTGELAAEFSQAIHDLNLESIVRVLGRTGHVPALLAAADVMLLTSGHGEGTPNVLLEAQSRGIPVVTSEAGGGAREAVLDGLSGLVFANEDLDGMAHGCGRLLSDSELRRKMSDEAVKFVGRRFSMFALERKLDALYRRPEDFVCHHHLQSQTRI